MNGSAQSGIGYRLYLPGVRQVRVEGTASKNNMPQGSGIEIQGGIYSCL